MVIQRGVRYLLTRWLILWGAILPVGVLAAYLLLHRDQPLGVTLATRPSQGLLWVSAVCVLLLMLRQRLTSLLDRLRCPGAVDPGGNARAYGRTIEDQPHSTRSHADARRSGRAHAPSRHANLRTA